ncbi:MAG: hypothetical protein ACKV2Q_03740 [Planctomycetaceae bacterium]
MPISVKCSECGKGLKAPDALAGKKAKCPQCGHVIPIPAAVLDAEEFDDEPPVRKPTTKTSLDKVKARAEEADDVADDDVFGDAFGASDSGDAGDDRRPCPMCGESIPMNAVKCRFCGEVLDASAGTLGRSTQRKSGKLSSDDRDLLRSFRRHAQWTGGFLIFIAFCVAFAGIGMLALAGQGQQPPGFGQPPGAQPLPAPQMAGALGVGFLVLAVFWLIMGIFVCLKHLWAAYVTTGMMGLSVAGNLMGGNFAGAAGAGAILAESIVIGQKGRELKRRGIPLNSKP